MNVEIEKAIKRAETKDKETVLKKIREWWNKNDYKVWRVILFPIWIATILKDKYNAWRNSLEVWNEERAKEILDYYVPRYCDWEEESKTFYFFDNGYGWNWSLAKKRVKRKDKRFWKVNHHKIRRYLIDSYELEGFEKEISDTEGGRTELEFKMIENN